MHSSRFFRVKPIARLIFKVLNFRKPYDFPPIPIINTNITTVFNDNYYIYIHTYTHTYIHKIEMSREVIYIE